jgi:DnaJ-domain-containing protein 1
MHCGSARLTIALTIANDRNENSFDGDPFLQAAPSFGFWNAAAHFSMRTHYDNLKVAENAPDEVMKAAYRALSQKYHPDKNGGDAEAQRIMQIINAAYAVLSDPVQRSRYDESLRQRRRRGAADATRTTSPCNDVPPSEKADPPPPANPDEAPGAEARGNSAHTDTAEGVLLAVILASMIYFVFEVAQFLFGTR